MRTNIVAGQASDETAMSADEPGDAADHAEPGEVAEHAEEDGEDADDSRSEVLDGKRYHDAQQKTITFWQNLFPQRGRPRLWASFSPQAAERRRVGLLSWRRTFWEHATDTFHPDALTSPLKHASSKEQEQQTKSLQFVYEALHPSLFELPHSDFENYKTVPPEVFEPIPFSEFVLQYTRLRDNVIPGLLKTPEGMYCWRVVAVKVKFLGSKNVVLVKPANVAVAGSSPFDRHWGADTSISIGSDYAIGREVLVKLPGGEASGVVYGFQKYIEEAKLYKLLMTLRYEEDVRRARIWHVLRLYHRVFMAGASTEALAELIGSMLTQRSSLQVGRHMLLSDLIGATKLRCAGVRGDPRDIGFIERSLNIYFRGGPWHFFVGDRTRQERNRQYPHGMLGSSVVLHRHELKMQVNRNFTWVRGTMDDIVQSCARRHLRVGGDIPCMETPRAYYQLRNKSGKLRDLLAHLREAQARHTPVKLDPRVWQDYPV